MDHHDEQMMYAFDRVRFGGEPPMASTSSDDLRRAERNLRRRRTTVLGSGVAGLAAVAAGAVLAIPALPDSGSSPSDVGVASGGAGVRAVQGDPAKAELLPLPRTGQLLFDTAAEHFDPDRLHLPGRFSAPAGGSVHDGRIEGNIHVGSKLGWTVPGEPGEGLVSVHVTTPGYATWEPYAVESFALEVGCDISGGTCRQQTIPGTDQKAWVADADPQQDLKLAVVSQRDDGSLVAVGVYDLFGNNSAVPVSDVDITLDDAFAFATDPELRFDRAEAAEGVDIAASGPGDAAWR